jgi:hypothetical protein
MPSQAREARIVIKLKKGMTGNQGKCGVIAPP